MNEFTPKAGLPLGKRFADVYVQRGKPTSDSPRMRRRAAAFLVDYGDKFEKYAEEELGVDTPWSTRKNWATCLEELPIEDVLNVVTVLCQYVSGLFPTGPQRAAGCKAIASRFNQIFEQENLSYRVDEKGGVHFHLDEEFARNAQATIAGLQDPRYANSLDLFEQGMVAMSKATPDGKTAIRNAFAAAEGLFRMMFPNSPRLTNGEAARLEPLLINRYGGNRAAAGATSKLLASFKDWIDACHFYRHEPGQPDEIAQPPIELTVHLVSVGAAFLRLLAELDEHGDAQ
jgi:hypothetical protein